MAEDEWEPVNAPAKTDDEWQPVNGPPREEPPIPKPFLDRILRGDALNRAMAPYIAAAKGAGEGMGSEPFGLSDEHKQQLRDAGIFPDPATGRGGAIRFMNEAVSQPIAAAGDLILRTGGAVVGGIAGAVRQQVEDAEGALGSPQAAENETKNFLNYMLLRGDHEFGRVEHGPAGPSDHPIGILPREQDFKQAAEVLAPAKAAPRFTVAVESGGKVYEGKSGEVHSDIIEQHHLPFDETLVSGFTDQSGKFLTRDEAARSIGETTLHATMMRQPAEQNLRTLWEEKGIHPAEAVADAQNDALFKHELKVAPLSSDITDIKNIPKPSIEEQPPQPLGRLVERGRAAMNNLYGTVQSIQGAVDPMSMGSPRAQALAKQTISSVRRVQFEGYQAFDDLTKRFDAEQWEHMWNAADEESVLRQEAAKGPLPEPVEGEYRGLSALKPEERVAVEREHANAQSAWLHAIDEGVVKGDGLPAYTPRVVLNVASALEHLPPRALNEFGRNAFTRTTQMLHRNYLLAEETEAAAKKLVTKRMTESGATAAEIEEAVAKVGIQRDIRTLPLATARLKEAVIWRSMINEIRATGKATGEDLVVVGDKPGKSWFTIEGHPAFTQWEPRTRAAEAIDTAPFPHEGRRVPVLDENGQTIMDRKPIWMPEEYRGPMRAILEKGPDNVIYNGLMALKGKAMTAILNSPLMHNEVVYSKALEAVGGKEWLGFNLYFKGNRIVSDNRTVGRASELIDAGLNPIGRRGSFQDISGVMEGREVEPHPSFTASVAGFVPGLFDPAAEAAVKQKIATAGNFVHNTLLWDRVRDLQFGLADHLSDTIAAKGVDRLTADRVASHFANMIVGSIPREAMSGGARATANMLLFSRGFTLGNFSVYKLAAKGLPNWLTAQIEREFGMPMEGVEGVKEAAQDIQQSAKQIARKKALSTIALSMGMYYIGNALLQHAFNIGRSSSNWQDAFGEEMAGYARRYSDLMADTSKDWFEMRHLISRMSPTYDNEPGKENRVYGGRAADGTAIYYRNVLGKYGEELTGVTDINSFIRMTKSKLNPGLSGILEVLENDKGFGHKIRDPEGGEWSQMAAIAKYMVEKHLPMQQLYGAQDLLMHHGDQFVAAARALGPVVGVTASQGAPATMAKGESFAIKQGFDTRFDLHWPDIKRQIQDGDVEGARNALVGIGTPPRMITGLIRNANNPAASLRGRTLRELYQKGTPEQLRRFEFQRQEGR